VDFAERGPRTDETIRVWHELWTTETSSFDGHWTTFDRMRFFPKASPLREGRIPILVGGNTPAAIHRAGVLGDGWHPINQSPGELRAGVLAYRAAAESAGRAAGPVVLRHMPGGRSEPEGPAPLSGSPEQQAADLVAYGEAGCDELLLSLWARDPQALGDRLEAFLLDVVPRTR
jgi:alkanesulfonate monooxygenase SsuD/methylene tetrahydromethanopterin reductase-like flavin-dependent oxidoreductase (luciferase family)